MEDSVGYLTDPVTLTEKHKNKRIRQYLNKDDISFIYIHPSIYRMRSKSFFTLMNNNVTACLVLVKMKYAKKKFEHISRCMENMFVSTIKICDCYLAINNKLKSSLENIGLIKNNYPFNKNNVFMKVISFSKKL